MNIKYLSNDFPFQEPVFNYFPCPRSCLFFFSFFFFSFFLLDQASNIEVLISLTSSFFQILRIKFYFLASILSAALQ